jgi:hypothetical protein
VSSRIKQIQAQLGRRSRQIRDLWKAEGSRGITHRVRRTAAEWLAPKAAILPARRADVLAADLSCRLEPAIPEVISGQPLTVNWVTTPAGPGSGGHTTLFRIIRYLEAHGYRNRVYFYDVYGGDHQYYESVVRRYYGFHGPVAKVDDGMENAHIVVATGWPTAYPVFNSSCAGARFYFVQDYEPYFHPVGALSFLAENTYRMGFHAITAGQWLAAKLQADFGMRADAFDFGSDTSNYRRLPDARRTGIVFYARPEAARRGFELGLMAIEKFASRQPDTDIHFYGQRMGSLGFKFIDHGRVTPKELNQIYNQCYAGLSLSLTNVSLVPHEMLAAGCIPVVNDAVHNRMVLNNPFVRYAPPYPQALASALETVIATKDFDSLSQAASASVRSSTWEDAGAAVDAILRRSIGGKTHSPDSKLFQDTVSVTNLS